MTTAYRDSPAIELPQRDTLPEELLVAELLAYPDSLEHVPGELQPEHFHDERMGEIYDALRRLENQGEPITIPRVLGMLRPGADGTRRDLAQRLPGLAKGALHGHAAYHAAQILEQARTQREALTRNRMLAALHRWADAGELRALVDEIDADGQPASDAPPFARLLSSDELLALDATVEYDVEGIIAARQCGVIGGLAKVLKTSVTIDLAVSLATGTRFLERFDSKRRRVAIWSGESGAAALRGLAQRIATAKQVDLAAADLLWSFDLPRLGRADHLQWLERTISEQGIQVAIIDPLFLSLLDARTANMASNVYAMGSALLPLTEIGQRTGCTMLALHHAKRSTTATSAGSDGGDVASLECLAQSGIVEWARQWIILQRRSPYQSDGHHELWMRAGGSAGHASLWALDVEEGTRDTFDAAPGDDGRHWRVTIGNPGDAREAAADKRERAKQDRQAAQEQVDVARVTKALMATPEGDTQSSIRDRAGLNTSRAAQALLTMTGTGHAVVCRVTKSGKEYDGYRYVSDPGTLSRDQSGQLGNPESVPVGGESGRDGSLYRARPDSRLTRPDSPAATIPSGVPTQMGRVTSFDAWNNRDEVTP